VRAQRSELQARLDLGRECQPGTDADVRTQRPEVQAWFDLGLGR
jgi:hypothetical protein